MSKSDELRGIRIEGDGMPRSTRVFIDGIDVSGYVKAIMIDIGVDRMPSAKIQLVAPLYIPDELKVMLQISETIE